MMDSPSPYERENRRTACGRNGCIAIYKTEDCHLCDMVNLYVEDLLKDEGYSVEVINMVHKSSIPDAPNIDGVTTAPAVRVCDVVMTGILDEEEVKRTIRCAANKKCFLEDIT